jgi:quinol monooxygenase YgiN
MKNSKKDERHIICTVRSQSAHRERVKALLLELVEPARLEEGCLYYDLYHDGKDEDAFYIVDGWVSEEAIASHGVHPNVARVVEQLMPLLKGPLEISTSNRLSENAR